MNYKAQYLMPRHSRRGILYMLYGRAELIWKILYV